MNNFQKIFRLSNAELYLKLLGIVISLQIVSDSLIDHVQQVCPTILYHYDNL